MKPLFKNSEKLESPPKSNENVTPFAQTLPLNRMERIAGLFFIVSITLIVITGFTISFKRGWFESTAKFYAKVQNAHSIQPGAPVQMSGLKIGTVETISLDKSGWVSISFNIYKRHLDKIKEDSKIYLVRPTIIGEKIFDITPGSSHSPPLVPNSEVKIENPEDLIEILSGKAVGVLIENLTRVSTELADLTHDISQEKNIQKLIYNLRTTTDGVRKAMPDLIQHTPQLTRDLSVLASNLSTLTTELSKVTPIFSKEANRLPAQSAKLIEVLSEFSILIKGMQRSFLFKGGVSDVKEEEQKKSQEKPKE